MSWMELKAIFPGEKTYAIEEFKNCSAGAPVVWSSLQGKYLFRREWSEASEHLKAIWALPVMPQHSRAVLAMTCDHAMILRADYARAAAHIRAWLADFENPTGHWQEIAGILDSNPDCPAVGFYLISTYDDPWHEKWVDWDKAWNIYEIMQKNFPNDTHKLTCECRHG